MRAGRRSPRIRASRAGATSTTTSGSSTTPTSTGPSCNDLAAEHPDKLRELVNLWFAEAGANGAFPLGRPVRGRDLQHPASAAHRGRGTATSTGLAPPRSRSGWPSTRRAAPSCIGALVDIPAPGGEGVLFAMGSRFGGHALYVKDSRLHYVNNFLGSEEQMIVGSEDIPTGNNLLLSASFEKEEQRAGPRRRNDDALPRRPQGRGARSEPSWARSPSPVPA